MTAMMSMRLHRMPPRRVALDAFGDIAEQAATNPFVRLLLERRRLFERETIAKSRLPFVDLSDAEPRE